MNRWFRPLLLSLGDCLAAVAAYWIAMQLRFEGSVSAIYQETLWAYVLLLVLSRLLGNISLRVHNWSFRFSGLVDGARIAMATLAGSGVFLGILYFLRLPGPPRSVVVLELLMTTLAMAAIRFMPRLTSTYVGDMMLVQSGSAKRTLIVGAGSAGEMLLRDIQRRETERSFVVGFVDDDPAKRNVIVSGKSVLGGTGQLRALIEKHRVDQVLIAIAQLSGPKIREILAHCADLNIQFKRLPASFIEQDRQDAATFMKELTPEDLLPRDPVVLESRWPLAGRLAVVTGAAGSIGSEICIQLARSEIDKIVLVDMNENGLYMLKERMRREHPATEVLIEVGDIRDEGRVRSIFERHRPHDVFHAAAHKHVPLMEAAPCEAVKNNVMGTKYVAEAADAVGAERMIYISTDKAVRPSSVMGACKRVGEEVVRSMAQRSATRFCAVRFGNVLGSAGSVVKIFSEQIAAGGPVMVTHPDVKRYFMTIGEAVALVLNAGYSDAGELCVLDMGEQLRIVELAHAMITMSGRVPGADIAIEFSGLRPGEKLFEELMTEDEERTHQVQRKIFVADCPRPRADIATLVAELQCAAAAEDENGVLMLLKRAVPSYTLFDPKLAAFESHATDAAAKPH